MPWCRRSRLQHPKSNRGVEFPKARETHWSGAREEAPKDALIEADRLATVAEEAAGTAGELRNNNPHRAACLTLREVRQDYNMFEAEGVWAVEI